MPAAPANKPWLTSTSLIEAVQRKISFPLNQNTFSDNDVLLFANDVLKDQLIANILAYHAEFFVTVSSEPLRENQSHYPIPNRAIGMKLRDVFYADGQTTPGFPFGNLYDMTQILPSERTWYGMGVNYGVGNASVYQFYVEGNNIVVPPPVGISDPPGLLVFYWYMRPNQLVEETRSFTVDGFSKTLEVTASSISAGDSITLSSVIFNNTEDYVVLTAVAGSPSTDEFQFVSGNSITTATNLVDAINASDIGFTATNGTTTLTNIITISYESHENTIVTSNTAAFEIQETIGLVSSSDVPSNITAGSFIDLLQTLPGHKTIGYDIEVIDLSTNTIILNEEEIPDSFIIGDYVCSVNECIIPQIPPELHSSLAERVAERLLNAIGDKDGSASEQGYIQVLNKNEGALIDNRLDGSPQKIVNKNSFLRKGWFNGIPTGR